MTVLTKDQKLLLANLVRDRKEVLFGKFSPTITKAAKNKKWDEIYEEMTAAGAVIKDAQHLQKTTWDNLRRRTLNRFQESKKTGAAGSELSELDSIILDCVKADASFLVGLGQNDKLPSFVSKWKEKSEEALESGECSKLEETTKSEKSQKTGTDAKDGESNTAAIIDKTLSTADDESCSEPQQDHKYAVALKSKQLKGHKHRNTSENLWSKDEFKLLKKQKLHTALEEQKIRIELMKDQSLLYQAQTQLAKKQAELVRLQAEELRYRHANKTEELLFAEIIRSAVGEQVLNTN